MGLFLKTIVPKALEKPLFPKLLCIWYICSQKLIISSNSLYENLLHCPYHKITIFLLCAVELCFYLKYSYILTACLLHVPRGNCRGVGGGLAQLRENCAYFIVCTVWPWLIQKHNKLFKSMSSWYLAVVRMVLLQLKSRAIINIFNAKVFIYHRVNNGVALVAERTL